MTSYSIVWSLSQIELSLTFPNPILRHLQVTQQKYQDTTQVREISAAGKFAG